LFSFPSVHCMRTGTARCSQGNRSRFWLHWLQHYIRWWISRGRLPELMWKENLSSTILSNNYVKTKLKTGNSMTKRLLLKVAPQQNWIHHKQESISTFVFKLNIIWLFASSNWSLSSLVVLSRTEAAFIDILTCQWEMS
jgi:hypothetical protein